MLRLLLYQRTLPSVLAFAFCSCTAAHGPLTSTGVRHRQGWLLLGWLLIGTRTPAFALQVRRPARIFNVAGLDLRIGGVISLDDLFYAPPCSGTTRPATRPARPLGSARSSNTREASHD